MDKREERRKEEEGKEKRRSQVWIHVLGCMEL